MKFVHWNIILFVFLVTGVNAQSLRMDQRVSFDYHNIRLEDALVDISKEYDIRFSYSAYYIPLNKTITVRVKNKTLDNALGNLFENTGIVYKAIGDQIVLRMAQSRLISQNSKQQQNDRARISQTDNAKINQRKTSNIPISEKETSSSEEENSREGYFQIPMNLEDVLEQEKSKSGGLARAKIPQALRPIEQRPMPNFDYSKKKLQLKIDWSHFEKLIEEIKTGTQNFQENIGQISLAPFVGTNFSKSNETINTASVNILWGINGGVDGIEIGVLANTIKYDVNGVQIAGLINTVGGNVEGVQVAGLLNHNNGTTNGAQAATFLNITNDVNALQLAGIANVAKEDVTGIQVAGLLNIVKGDADYQLAGLTNRTKGNVSLQMSVFSNKANGTVSIGQVGVANKAGYVKGFQLGFINVCDSIAGVPVGLINIVKHGKNRFNKIELSYADLLTGNFALKIGAKKFYNILHFGLIKGKDNDDSWALGYGFGRAFNLSNRSLINLELSAMHVNEKSSWTNQLNLLNQLKLHYDFRFARRFSVFVGPTANVFVSQIYNSDNNTFGTSLITDQKLLFDNQNENSFANDTNVKAWIGFNAGLRF